MSDRDYTIEVDEVLKDTDASILVRVASSEKDVIATNGSDEVWIPKSQIREDDSEVTDVGDVGTLVVSMWLAEERGWV
jgi:hypothetical protein